MVTVSVPIHTVYNMEETATAQLTYSEYMIVLTLFRNVGSGIFLNGLISQINKHDDIIS
jgi:hypothetical protein